MLFRSEGIGIEGGVGGNANLEMNHERKRVGGGRRSRGRGRGRERDRGRSRGKIAWWRIEARSQEIGRASCRERV